MDVQPQKLSEMLPTGADAARGYFDVKVQDKMGAEHVVRLSLIAPSLRRQIVARFFETEDPKDAIRALVEPKFARDEFLDLLKPDCLGWLAIAGLALLLGPDALDAELRARLGNFS
jgi:hypothetical protein